MTPGTMIGRRARYRAAASSHDPFTNFIPVVFGFIRKLAGDTSWIRWTVTPLSNMSWWHISSIIRHQRTPALLSPVSRPPRCNYVRVSSPVLGFFFTAAIFYIRFWLFWQHRRLFHRVFFYLAWKAITPGIVRAVQGCELMDWCSFRGGMFSRLLYH